MGGKPINAGLKSGAKVQKRNEKMSIYENKKNFGERQLLYFSLFQYVKEPFRSNNPRP